MTVHSQLMRYQRCVWPFNIHTLFKVKNEAKVKRGITFDYGYLFCSFFRLSKLIRVIAVCSTVTDTARADTFLVIMEKMGKMHEKIDR